MVVHTQKVRSRTTSKNTRTKMLFIGLKYVHLHHSASHVPDSVRGYLGHMQFLCCIYNFVSCCIDGVGTGVRTKDPWMESTYRALSPLPHNEWKPGSLLGSVIWERLEYRNFQNPPSTTRVVYIGEVRVKVEESSSSLLFLRGSVENCKGNRGYMRARLYRGVQI